MGAIAAKAAYDKAEPWLDDLIGYVNNNFIYLKQSLEQHLPGVKVFNMEGTYLAWADFKPLGFSSEKIVEKIEQEAIIALDHGDWFAENGTGFERFNLACPRSILKKAVESIIKAFQR